MRKLVLYCALGGVFGLAILLETLVTNRPSDRPDNRLVLKLGSGPQTIPEEPPEEVRARTRSLSPPGGSTNLAPGSDGKGTDPTPPAGSKKSPDGADTYVVQKNDTFWDIAAKTLGSATEWKRLAQYNDLEPDELRAGMTLKIPPRLDQGQASTPKSPAPTTGRTHTMESGETLGDVAQKYLGSAQRWKEIQTLNGIKDPQKVRAGQVLKLPDS